MRLFDIRKEWRKFYPKSASEEIKEPVGFTLVDFKNAYEEYQRKENEGMNTKSVTIYLLTEKEIYIKYAKENDLKILTQNLQNNQSEFIYIDGYIIPKKNINYIDIN